MTETAIAFWMFLQSIMLVPAVDPAPVQSKDASQPVKAGIECRVDIETVRGEAVLLAKVSAGAVGGRGDFLLEIVKTGSSNAKIRRRGTFDVASGAQRTVEAAKVSVEAGDRVEARLLLKTADGERSCTP